MPWCWFIRNETCSTEWHDITGMWWTAYFCLFVCFLAYDKEKHNGMNQNKINVQINFNKNSKYIHASKSPWCQSQWPRGLRRGSAAARLLGLWVRIPPEAWVSVSFECRVLSGSSLCVGLITPPEESYRVWCVWVWSWILHNEEALPHWGLLRHSKKKSPLWELSFPRGQTERQTWGS